MSFSPSRKLSVSLLQEFFDYIREERIRDLELLVGRYRSIGPMLTKVEGMVLGTNTGRCQHLQDYYFYWEDRSLFFSEQTAHRI